MSEERKKSVLDALNKYSAKSAKEAAPKAKRKRNKSPEKEVEKECLALMRSWGWTVEVYEAKATWNGKAWVQPGMKGGTCDCMGTTDEGINVSVEFKAPGRLSTFNSQKRFKQRQFIVTRIEANGFACVVDSAKGLEVIYMRWAQIREKDKIAARNFLINSLPNKKPETGLEDDDLFGDE